MNDAPTILRAIRSMAHSLSYGQHQFSLGRVCIACPRLSRTARGDFLEIATLPQFNSRETVMTEAEIDAMFVRMPRVCALVPVPSGRAVLDCRMMRTQMKGRAPGQTLAFVPIGLVVQPAA